VSVGHFKSGEYYPRQVIVDLVGDRPSALAGRDTRPSLARNYRRIRAGNQQWVSLAFADNLLTECGYSLWELGEPTRFPLRGYRRVEGGR
jgi:hypothetical protein